MGMGEISLYVLLGHLLIAGLASSCPRCNDTEQTPAANQCQCCLVEQRCTNESSVPVGPSNCTEDCKVSVNTTGSNADEGDQITLTCAHDLPECLRLMFKWTKDDVEMPGQNKSQLVLTKVLSPQAGQYVCIVRSPCGTFESEPHGVTVNNNSVLLLVLCGISALVLVVILGLIMKFKLKRDNAKHKERMRQRAQAEQSGGPAPFTPRES